MQELMIQGERWVCTWEPAGENLHYLYSLRREGQGNGPLALYIGLWPHPRLKSLLHACAKFAHKRGNHPVEVAFIYGLKAPSKEALARAADPVGPLADKTILSAARRAHWIYCVWGGLGPLPHRPAEVVIQLRKTGARLECFHTPDQETGTPHDPSNRFRIRSPVSYNYWPAPAPPSDAPVVKVRSISPKNRIKELTEKRWFALGDVSFFGLFEPGLYQCPHCGAGTGLKPTQLHGDADKQCRGLSPDIEHAFERVAPESRWGLAHDFHCKGCQRPVRIIYDVSERFGMSGNFYPGISRVLELED